jgi:hypothetical protein
MHMVTRNYSGPGAKELFDLLEKRKSDVKEVIGAVHGIKSYAMTRTHDGGYTVTMCDDKAGMSTAERKCIAVAEQRCSSWRDEKGPRGGPSHLVLSRAAVGWRRTWASAAGACSAGADSCRRSSRGCGRDG